MTDLPEIEWRKSSLCNSSSCVEVAYLGNKVAIRDSKQANQAPLFFSEIEFRAFLELAKNGAYDFSPGKA